MKRTPCNWLLSPTWKSCPVPAAGMVKKAGYCLEHGPKAAKMFGEFKPFLREEMFEPTEMAGK
jgi:hypothetical protein